MIKGLVQVVLLAIAIIALDCAVTESDYCKLCEFHTMCETKVPGPLCKSATSFQPGPKDQALILDRHNIIRNNVAGGNEKRGTNGPQLSAANMMVMEWDNELAKIAQRMADQCAFKHDCRKCRSVINGRFQVGQNQAMLTTTGTFKTIDYKSMIELWFEEVKLFNKSHISKFQFDSSWGHYSQLVWWNTRLVGCGASVFEVQPNVMGEMLVCNYGSSGNLADDQMYKVSNKSCSDCPQGTVCDKRFTNLCHIPLPNMASFHTDKEHHLGPNIYLRDGDCIEKGFRSSIKKQQKKTQTKMTKTSLNKPNVVKLPFNTHFFPPNFPKNNYGNSLNVQDFMKKTTSKVAENAVSKKQSILEGELTKEDKFTTKSFCVLWLLESGKSSKEKKRKCVHWISHTWRLM